MHTRPRIGPIAISFNHRVGMDRVRKQIYECCWEYLITADQQTEGDDMVSALATIQFGPLHYQLDWHGSTMHE